TGVLHTWGRQLQYHFYIYYIVSGGGLSKDCITWCFFCVNFFVFVKAFFFIYRALFKEEMRQAGLLEHIDPQVWTIPWNVHSQANPHGHSPFISPPPYVSRVAFPNRRIVGLQDR